MTQDSNPSTPTPSERNPQVFPVLDRAQIERVAAYGKTRRVARGEVLVEQGEETMRFLVVLSGRLEVLQSDGNGERIVATHDPGEFFGDVHLLSGRRSIVRARMATDGEVLELSRESLQALVQTDSALSEILMRAFILRRLELTKGGKGDAALIGSSYSAETLRVREFLTRNGYPHEYVDLERDPGAQQLLDRFNVSHAELPVLICRAQSVLRNPTNRQIAECLGLNEGIDETQVRDVLIVGAGPAGLAAAVYAASEGLKSSGGGDKGAGWTSRIELQDRKLSRISRRSLRRRTRRPRLQPGAKIRRRNDRRPQRQTPRLRPETVRHRVGRRQQPHGSNHHYRHRRRIPETGARKPGDVRRPRHILRRNVHRIANLRRQ